MAIAAQAALEEFRTRSMERDLRAFTAGAWHVIEPATTFIPNWHLDAIADHLMAVSDGQIRRLVINIPPRHSKSLSACVLWPAWEWCRRPEIKSLYTSYSKNFALRDSVATRRLIQSPWYQRRWGHVYQLTSDQNVKSRFENNRSGFRLAGSFLAPPSGDGGHKVVADDPIDIKKAQSVNELERVIETWVQVLSTRLNDPKTGAHVIVMQRLHERDLTGHVLSHGGYVELRLPAEYEPASATVTVGGVRPRVEADDSVVYQREPFRDPRTEEGELLNPRRFGPEEIAHFKGPEGLGPRHYAGQFQQRPSPAGGTIFLRERWQRWTVLPVRDDGSLDFEELWQSWDCTFKDEADSDWVVGQVWGVRGAVFYLLAQIRERLSFSGTAAAIKNLSDLWPLAHRKLIEDKANGPAILDHLKREVPGMKPEPVEGSKIARAHSVEPYQTCGNIAIPHATDAVLPVVTPAEDPKAPPVVTWEPYPCPWVPGFIEEAAQFPNGAHDDQVDALTQAINFRVRRPRPRVRALR